VFRGSVLVFIQYSEDSSIREDQGRTECFKREANEYSGMLEYVRLENETIYQGFFRSSKTTRQRETVGSYVGNRTRDHVPFCSVPFKGVAIFSQAHQR